jgi:beta-galactosidase
VQTQTNCETVELIVNGTSFGQRKSRDYNNSGIEWHVPYAPGRVQAIGRRGNSIVARHELKTAGPGARIELAADRAIIAADSQDVSHVFACIVDRDGVIVPTADQSLQLKLTGPGKIIGLDNGDLASSESYQSKTRETRQGRCLAIVQSEQKPGAIKLSVRARGLVSGAITIRSR